MQTSELKEIVQRLAQENPEIDAVYLFGSLAKDNASEPSDIDLAFLFDKLPYRSAPLNAFFEAQMLGSQISEFCNKHVDVAVLNEASLLFIYEVITTGKCIYEKDHIKRILYEIAVKGQFYDFKPFITQLRDRKLKRILEAV